MGSLVADFFRAWCAWKPFLGDLLCHHTKPHRQAHGWWVLGFVSADAAKTSSFLMSLKINEENIPLGLKEVSANLDFFYRFDSFGS